MELIYRMRMASCDFCLFLILTIYINVKFQRIHTLSSAAPQCSPPFPLSPYLLA